MRRVRALVPLRFFRQLFPFNGELLKGNAFSVKACGAQPSDGSILRSKEYLLFGNGIATILVWQELPCPETSYVMEFIQKYDQRGTGYWEIQCDPNQESCYPEWTLTVSATAPDEDDLGHVIPLIQQTGDPGQYFFLSCPS